MVELLRWRVSHNPLFLLCSKTSTLIHILIKGGHNVPEQDIMRRFERSWINFQQIYKPLADSWIVFDTSGSQSVILDESER
jgi:predicted ABC-type ATPase